MLVKFTMSDTELCPLDSRRGETEVFIKRMAIMITVLCLLGHLNSLRGVRSPSKFLLSIYLTILKPLHPLSRFIWDIIVASYKVWADLTPCQDHRVLQLPQESVSWNTMSMQR